jgi:hypothetical protein
MSPEFLIHANLAVDNPIDIEVVFVLDRFTAATANRKPFQ